jgi:hypothetical protein
MRADRDFKPGFDPFDRLQIRGSKLKALLLLDTDGQEVRIDDPDRAGK